MLSAVVYSRVSTDAQERDGTSLDTQERACLEQLGGYKLLECIRDTASGYTLDRPGMERVRELLRQGAVDVVFSYAVDRLSRNQNHIGVLFDEIERAGARLEIITEKFEDTAMGRFILSARAFIAEVEREKIAERTMRGKEERARKGKIPQGTGKGCYGYRYSKETGQRQVVEEEARIVRRIFEEFCRHASCHGIACRLNEEGVPAFGKGLWHPLTIRRILHNETYTGRTIYRKTKVEKVRDPRTSKKKRRVIAQAEEQWIEVPGASPAIISETLFCRAQSILADPSRRLMGKPTRRYRLRGHLRCLQCGTPMVGQALGGGRYQYYRCRRSYSGKFEDKCPAKYVRVDALEQLVLSEISAVLSEPERILNEAKRVNGWGKGSHAVGIKQELKDIEARQRRLAKLYLDGSVPEDFLSQEGKRLNRRREFLETKMLDSSSSEVVDLELLERDLPAAASRLQEWVMHASQEDLELILEALQVEVRASSESVAIQGVVPVPQVEDLVTIEQTSA